MQNTFSTGTTKILDRVFYNLPAIILATTILIRLLVAVFISIVAVAKFQFLGEIAAIILGVFSVVLLETIITVLSIINANFRKMPTMEDWVPGILVLIILLSAYNGYMLQSIVQFYEMPYKISALLTLHVLNVVSIILMESISFIQVQTEIAKPTTATEPRPIEISQKNIESYFEETELPELFAHLKSKGYTQKAIAEKLQISESKISRILNQTKQN